jgi:hypothetical protein
MISASTPRPRTRLSVIDGYAFWDKTPSDAAEPQTGAQRGGR